MDRESKNLPEYIESIKNPIEDFNFLTAGYKFSSNTTVIDNLISSGQIELLIRHLLNAKNQSSSLYPSGSVSISSRGTNNSNVRLVLLIGFATAIIQSKFCL